jgi:hypothetical protein
MRLRRIVIGLSLALMVSLGVPIVASAGAKETHPTPPSGYHIKTRDISHEKGAQHETIHLNKAECSALQPMAGSACSVEHYSLRQPTTAPKGVKHVSFFGVAFADASYQYWSWGDEMCSMGQYGCWFDSVTTFEDGQYIDGWEIWKWSQSCTASGWNTTVTYCGEPVNENDGSWPYQGIQFGVNYTTCAAAWNVGCYGHGRRRWIMNNGQPGSTYTW